MHLFQVRVSGGLEVRWTALQCVLTIQPPLLSQCRAQRDANSCSIGRGRDCNPAHSTALLCKGTSVPQDTDQSWSFHMHTRMKGAPHTESSDCRELAGLSSARRPGWKAAHADTTDVWERWWLRHSSSTSCRLLSQSLAAAVWRRHSPTHGEITSDNAGKRVCFPFMRASYLGPNSGCAKMFSPEEMCLLITIYWINWFPICSAALLIPEPCCCYWKVSGVVTTQEVHQNTSVNLKSWSVFVFIKFKVYPSMAEDMEKAFKISNWIIIFKKPTQALTSATSAVYSRSRRKCWSEAINSFLGPSPAVTLAVFLSHTITFLIPTCS